MSSSEMTYNEMYRELTEFVDAAITNRESHFLRPALREEQTSSMSEQLDEPLVETETSVSASANAEDVWEDGAKKEGDLEKEEKEGHQKEQNKGLVSGNEKEKKEDKGQGDTEDTEEPLSWIEMVLLEEKENQDKASNETATKTNSEE